MKKEWTEQDLRAFAENAQTAFEDVTLTEADEEAADTWQDDGLQVDYVLRNGQVDCVLRRLIEADGKLWQLQMTAPLAGSDLPEDRMTARERELCRDDMNHDFLTGAILKRSSAPGWMSGRMLTAVLRWRWWRWTMRTGCAPGRAMP